MNRKLLRVNKELAKKREVTKLIEAAYAEHYLSYSIDFFGPGARESKDQEEISVTS